MSVRLYHTGDRFEVRSSYDERGEVKEAGFRWDPGIRRWWTDRPERARKLRRYADPSALKALKTCEEAIAESRATSVVVGEIPIPEGLEFRPFQKAGIQFALARPATLIADEMGLGKTPQAIGVLNALPRKQAFPALVVCPASLKLNWERELQRFGTHSVSVGIASGSSLPATDIVVVNYDILARNLGALVKRQWAVVVADEVHFAKNLSYRKVRGSVEDRWVWQGSQRAKALQQLVAGARRRLFLTGTPILNRPRDIYPLLCMLDPDQWRPRGFFRWALRYCAAHDTGHGWDFDGADHLDELQDTLRSTVMIRRLKSEVLAELPAKTRTLVSLTPGRGMLSHERKFRKRLRLAETDDYEEATKQLSRGGPDLMTEMARARHTTAMAKAPKVVDFVREVLESEDKTIVFAHHRDVVDVLREGLDEFRPVTVVGGDSMTARQEAVDRFQNDPQTRVLIGNIRAAGVGLTLTASRTVVFAELDWTPSNVTQAEDRAHRIGQRDNVTVYHVVLDDSIDAHLAKMLVEKQKTMDAALDDRQPLVIPAPQDPESRPDRRRADAAEPDAEPMPRKRREAIHRGLQMLAGVCDGAARLDQQGFSRMDTEFGHNLAAIERLTDRQAEAGFRLVRKYRRQLPGDLLRSAGVG